MAVTMEDVQKVAALAKLRFSDDEMKMFTNQMNDILGYIEKLNELDTEDIPPTSHSFTEKNVFREDEIKPCLTQEEALLNAPAKTHGHFIVPKVIR